MDLHVREECELFERIALFIFKLFFILYGDSFWSVLNNSLEKPQFQPL